MTIHIRGLTRKQVAMLDLMWSMQDIEEVEAWQASLNDTDRAMSRTLMDMIFLEMVDEVAVDDFSEANEILARFRQ